MTSRFPLNGEYEITIRLARDRNEHIEGLIEPHEIELLIDGERVRLFTVEPPRSSRTCPRASTPSHENLDSHLKVRVPVSAGPHALGVTFPKKPSLLLETARQPYQAHFNYYRHPRLQPAVYEISIVGPYDATGAGDTPSRRRVFACRPVADGRRPTEADLRLQDAACAKRILSTLMRRAYRRPVTDADLKKPFELYQHGAEPRTDSRPASRWRSSAVLSSPEFLFRVERDPAAAAAVRQPLAYRISDLELASRLSFFLWSSIPDDELLDVAARGELDKPAVLERQVRRMLADARSENLVTNFASQWLHLRNLDAITPGHAAVPGFRRQPAAGVPAGNGAARRQRHARGPQRARPAARELHVRQRAARQALRHSECLRQPLPPDHVRRCACGAEDPSMTSRERAAGCFVRAAFCSSRRTRHAPRR